MPQSLPHRDPVSLCCLTRQSSSTWGGGWGGDVYKDIVTCDPERKLSPCHPGSEKDQPRGCQQILLRTRSVTKKSTSSSKVASLLLLSLTLAVHPHPVLCCCCFPDRVSQMPGWPPTPYVTKDNLDPLFFLCLPSRGVSPHA